MNQVICDKCDKPMELCDRGGFYHPTIIPYYCDNHKKTRYAMHDTETDKTDYYGGEEKGKK